MDVQEEIARLLVIQIRRAATSQAQVVQELARSGFGPARIAQLLGTTTATVNTDLKRGKSKKPTGGRS